MPEDLIARIRHRADNPSTRVDLGRVSSRFPPVTPSAISQAEHRIGFGLPSFLADVYQRVGNGGFGPGYGLIGLPGGYLHDDERSIVELYELYRAADSDAPTWWQWPDGLVPLCDWGCAIFSCVACDTGAIITFDSNQLDAESGRITEALAQSHSSVAAWFEDWVKGVKLFNKILRRFRRRAEGR
jgi:hypothetical protein